MNDSPALQNLQEMIAREEVIIQYPVVIKAIHEMLGVSLEAANEVEDMLVKAGYEQTKRGDWALFDRLV